MRKKLFLSAPWRFYENGCIEQPNNMVGLS
jgi:hypothetical protein